MATSTTINDVHNALASLDLWYKLKSGDNIVLTDVPEFIPLRWTYFRDRWLYIKDSVLQGAFAATDDPDFLKSQADSFTSFIQSQRNGNKNLNPLSDGIVVHKFYQVFNSINIGDINLSNEEQRILDNRLRVVSHYSKNNFLDIKRTIQNYRDSLSDVIGLSDDSYNVAVDRSSVPSQRAASITDINLLVTLEKSIASVDYILANLFAVDAFVDPFAVARVNANNPEINIGQYSSGNLVKIEYGQSLESLAKIYLGDPAKWIDIAIANGLKPPYIDEIGQKIPFLANGNGNQINLASVDSTGNDNVTKFFINQIIYIQSDVYSYPNQRTIVNITVVPVSGEIILEVDGEPNLNLYKTSENANIRVFKPNTISSTQYILIPSTNPLDNFRNEEVPWFLAKSPEDEKQAKVDISLTGDGDFNVTSSGDISLSYGIHNAIQALKIKLAVELGSLAYHPTFGFVSVIGSRSSDLKQVRSQIVNSINQQIRADARFSRLESLNISFSNTAPDGLNSTNAGSTVSISMVVRLAGGSTNIPISFTVNY